MGESPPPSATPTLAATPAPIAAAAAAEPAQHLAPEGTYFLLELVTTNTPTGVIGDRPGTKVTLVKRGSSSVQVMDAEHHIFTVKSSQLTNDIGIATQIAKADAEKQSQIKKQIATQQHDYDAQMAERSPAAAQQRIQPQVQPTLPPLKTGPNRLDRNPPGNPLERGAYNATDAKRYHDKYGEYWIDIWGKRHYVSH